MHTGFPYYPKVGHSYETFDEPKRKVKIIPPLFQEFTLSHFALMKDYVSTNFCLLKESKEDFCFYEKSHEHASVGFFFFKAKWLNVNLGEARDTCVVKHQEIVVMVAQQCTCA